MTRRTHPGRKTDAAKQEDVNAPLSDLVVIEPSSYAGYFLARKTSESVEGVPVFKETHYFTTVGRLRAHIAGRRGEIPNS